MCYDIMKVEYGSMEVGEEDNSVITGQDWKSVATSYVVIWNEEKICYG